MKARIRRPNTYLTAVSELINKRNHDAENNMSKKISEKKSMPRHAEVKLQNIEDKIHKSNQRGKKKKHL